MRPGRMRRSSASLAWPVLSYTAHTFPTALAQNGHLLSTTRITAPILTVNPEYTLMCQDCGDILAYFSIQV